MAHEGQRKSSFESRPLDRFMAHGTTMTHDAYHGDTPSDAVARPAVSDRDVGMWNRLGAAQGHAADRSHSTARPAKRHNSAEPTDRRRAAAIRLGRQRQ
jgi:hypothetical protein